jgi:predicted RND superfamily exporter protein
MTRVALASPRATLVVLGLVTLLLAGGLPRLRTAFGYRVLIGDDHPAIQAIDGLIERFGGGLPMMIAWECGDGHPCESVFDRTSLSMAHAVAEALAPIDGVQNVQGPANAGLLVPDSSGFAIRRFVENGEPVSDAAVLAIRALDDPLWVGSLVSEDGRVGVILVQPTDTKSQNEARMVDVIEEILAPFEARGFTFWLSGDAIENVIVGRDLAESTANLIPFTVLVIGLVLFALARSWQSVAVALGSMGVALVWTYGLLGWLDWPQDGILEVLAPLILVVGVCDAIHLLSRYSAELDVRRSPFREGDPTEAILEAARDVGAPCLITTLTTAAAFLSFTTSTLDTFVRFGSISAFGVAACLVVTFTLLPVLARMLPPRGARSERASEGWDSALEAIARTSQKRAGPILAVTAVLFAVCGIGWFGHLRVDTHWMEALGEHSQVVRSIRFLEDHLGQSMTLEIEVLLPADVTAEDPATLHTVSAFSEYLTSLDGLASSSSVVDLVHRLNRLLHDDDVTFERPGDTAGANAEILELINFDDPSLLANWLSLDRSRLRISVEAPDQPPSKIGPALESIRDYIRSELPPNWNVILSGEFAMSFDWIRDVQNTQVRSFPIALILVFAMVTFFLGSIRLSAAAMVPTLLPIVVTLGAMGWAGMSLDIGRAMIAAILIGIAVDDAIHLLSQYKIRRSRGDDPEQAIRAAVLHVGRAVVTTSLALSLGFLTLMASAWQTISSFGFFVALAILGALGAALLVLPALIFSFARNTSSEHRNASA